MLFEPRVYQKGAIDFVIENEKAALFIDPGLGKTGIMLSAISTIKDLMCPALIIAPKRVASIVWPGEISKFKESFGCLSYRILIGDNKEKSIYEDADLYMLNTENIFWAFKCRLFKSLIIDESSKFKSYRAKRFKALRAKLSSFNRRYILSGTPSPNSLMDLFSQQYIVDQGLALGRYITHYRNRFFDQIVRPKYIDYKVKRGADVIIRNLIAATTFRLDQKDNLKLPDIIYNTIPVELTARAYKIYRDAEKNLMLTLEGSETLITESVQLYNLCCQIANGRVYTSKEIINKSRESESIHSAKIDAISDLIDELQGKPILIAYYYKHDLLQLENKFGSDLVELDTNPAENIKKWNQGEIRIMACHPGGTAHGLNLQHGGNDIIWFAPPDNLENYLQFNRRIYRQGVTGQVRIHLIVANKTVDMVKLRRLGEKDRSQNAFLEMLKDHCNGKNMGISQW